MMDFNLPMRDDEDESREAIRALAEMVAKRRSNQQPVEEAPEEDSDIVSAKQAALRGIAGEPDYSGLDLGEQVEEDIVAPDMPESATGEPVLEDDKLAKLKAIQQMLEKQR